MTSGLRTHPWVTARRASRPCSHIAFLVSALWLQVPCCHVTGTPSEPRQGSGLSAPASSWVRHGWRPPAVSQGPGRGVRSVVGGCPLAGSCPATVVQEPLLSRRCVKLAHTHRAYTHGAHAHGGSARGPLPGIHGGLSMCRAEQKVSPPSSGPSATAHMASGRPSRRS